ncbi:cyclase [Streptomyces sp. NPDC052236]|uniref:cyclase n=1 Tax=Streptomyces sp. NPDC052236 TaxID=3365686 RepID=UPI0037D70608
MAEKLRPLSADNPATQHLKAELQNYLAAQTERMLVGVGHGLGQATIKLTDVAEGRSPGFARLALEGGRKALEGKGPLRSAVEIGASRAKENITHAVKDLGRKRKKAAGGKKPVVIMENVDIGAPARQVHDEWNRFQEVSSARGHTQAVITFHTLDDNLTRVLLVMEYYPKGFGEKASNIWRAQGRRARRDLRNFARQLAMSGAAAEGLRGEIRDGEVVRAEITEGKKDRKGKKDKESKDSNEKNNEKNQDDTDSPEGREDVQSESRGPQ